MIRMFVLAAVVFGLVSGCATSARQAQGQSTRALAMATDDTPFLVSVTLPDLRPPSDIREDCSTYVAWVRTADGRLRHAGEVTYDASTRRGRIDLLSSTDDFTLLVTAEPGPGAARPSLDALVVRQPSAAHAIATGNASRL